MKYPKSVYLTNEQANMLEDIARQTKADWFWLHLDEDPDLPGVLADDVGLYYKAKDLEAGCFVSFKTALFQLFEGTGFDGENFQNVSLTPYQRRSFLQMLAKEKLFPKEELDLFKEEVK